MDFDLSKENIQPLRGGRNIQQLGMALQAQSNREYQLELLQQKEEFENLIRNYTGDDPLENYYNYISWIEQSYPKHGHEGNLIPLLEHCLSLFENDKRYTNDRRFCKLWIKYFDLQQNPLELYHMMRAKGLCRGCADLYRAWAYYYEAVGDFQNANNVFEDGKRALAQPYEDLENAHKNLIMAAGQHLLYGPNETHLMEKRQALTSLHTYRPGRVSSVRVPSSNGIVTVPSEGATVRSNAEIFVYEDKGNVSTIGAEAAPLSLITVAKRQEAPKENTLKPGPWTTVPVKKRVIGSKSTPGFTVLEDPEDVLEGIRLHPNHPKECLEDYSDWRVSIKYPEPPNPAMIPMYPKDRVYIDPNTEYSIDELRASRYLRNINKFHIPQLETYQAVQSILEEEVMQESLHEINNHPNTTSFNQNEVVHRLTQQEEFVQDGMHQSLQDNRVSSSFHQNSIQQKDLLHTPTQQHPSHSEHREDEPSQGQFLIWSESPVPNTLDLWSPPKSKRTSNHFVVYEQTLQDIHQQRQPKGGSAMKTAFKDLNAEELAETGSRGGMDIAATAQAADSAKAMPLFSDNSSSSFDDLNAVNKQDYHQDIDTCCNTQMFNFNLNVMQVSTPQSKRPVINSNCNEEIVGNTRKQLFMEPKVQEKDKALSTILEETKSYGSTSSSSGATTKSSLFNNHTNKMGTISEEHNSYLAQNLMANAALRSSLLGNLMDLDAPHSPLLVEDISKNEPTVPMQSSPFASPVRRTPAPAIVRPLDEIPSDPFKGSLLNRLLERVAFPGPHTYGYISLVSNPRICIKKEPIIIGNEKYIVEKQLGKGTFGTVFKALDVYKNKSVALKSQKPPNRWEYYICRELQARLAEHPLRDCFMDISLGYFGDQVSILVSDYMPGGSLLDLANTYKLKFGKTMKECLVIYFTIQMLKIIQAMHEVKVIHADIKPDNFLVFVLPDNTVGLQLIDFGCSIDMSLFPANTSFMRRVTTEDFICCEMLDGRPWNYHTDLFCIAATTHVLLFDTYIKLRKQEGLWSITQRFARYMKVDLWNIFFNDLLNQQLGPADSSSLLNMLIESLNYKENSIEM
ncbi:hypothetical protein NQ315_004887, partial [Exocentrus adspersus]